MKSIAHQRRERADVKRDMHLLVLSLTVPTNVRFPLVLLQAFLELADEGAAATMVTYYASAIAQLRGRAVYVQFSNHRELKTDQTHSNNAVSSPTNDVANTSEVCVILFASSFR